MKSSPTLSWCALNEQTLNCLGFWKQGPIPPHLSWAEIKAIKYRISGLWCLCSTPTSLRYTLGRANWPSQSCQKIIHSYTHTLNPDDNWCFLTSLWFIDVRKLKSCIPVPVGIESAGKKGSPKCFSNNFEIRQLCELSFEALFCCLFCFFFECCFHHEFKWILQDSKESYWTWEKEKRGSHGDPY